VVLFLLGQQAESKSAYIEVWIAKLFMAEFHEIMVGAGSGFFIRIF